MNPFNLFKKDSKENSDTRRSFIRKSLLGMFGVTTAMIATREELFATKSKTGYIYVKQNGEIINNYVPTGATPFLGQLMCVGWNFTTQGWYKCEGQILPIAQNTALFSLFGTMYGGNGSTTFGLPDLRGRVSLHHGNGYIQGEVGGSATHTLLISEIPSHNHLLNINTVVGSSGDPSNKVLSPNAEGIAEFSSLAPNGTMNAQSIGSTGGDQPHNNMQPYLVLNWQVAFQGIFPSQSD